MSVRSRAGVARRRADAVIAALSHRASGPPTFDPVASATQRDRGDFENMRRLLAFVLTSDSCCIDVGAHRGAVLAEMRRAAPEGRHVAFEPIPQLAQFLCANFPGVDVHQAALSSQPGESEFVHVRGDAEGWSGLRFRPLPSGVQAESERIKVRLEVLDDVLDPAYRPAVIKIDVEGAEQQVFQGALKTLRRHRPIVIFEHGSGSAEAYGTSPSDIYALLRHEAGFRIFDLDGNGPYTPAEFERSFYAAERVNFVAHA